MRLMIRGLPALGLALLAACSTPAAPGGATIGARGTTVESVRGSAPGNPNAAAPLDGVLRPEPGNIWSEGLETARPPAAR